MNPIGRPLRRPVAAVVPVAVLALAFSSSPIAPASGHDHSAAEAKAGGARAQPSRVRHRRARHRRRRVVRVNIRSFAYHPPTLRIRRGTRVVFTNRDRVAHTATRRHGFNTRRVRPGHSVVVRLRRAGVYAYYCTLHPFMHGKIVVR